MLTILSWMIFIPTGVWSVICAWVIFDAWVTDKPFIFAGWTDFKGVILPMIAFFLSGTLSFRLVILHESLILDS